MIALIKILSENSEATNLLYQIYNIYWESSCSMHNILSMIFRQNFPIFCNVSNRQLPNRRNLPSSPSFYNNSSRCYLPSFPLLSKISSRRVLNGCHLPNSPSLSIRAKGKLPACSAAKYSAERQGLSVWSLGC